MAPILQSATLARHLRLGWIPDRGKSNAILDAFTGRGGNFVDTARFYGHWIPDGPVGARERTIGARLNTQNRVDVIVATKGGFFDMRVGGYRKRCTPQGVEQDLSQRLNHIGIGTIDPYFLPMDNPEVPVEAQIDALAGHRNAGRMRHFAASNWLADRIAAANAYVASIGKPGIVASQTFWGLAAPDRTASGAQRDQHYYKGEYEGLHSAGLPIFAYAGQSGGYFTKLVKGEVNAQLAARYANPVNEHRFAAAEALAKQHDVAINEVVLVYLLCQLDQTNSIFGGSNIEHIEASARA